MKCIGWLDRKNFKDPFLEWLKSDNYLYAMAFHHADEMELAVQWLVGLEKQDIPMRFIGVCVRSSHVLWPQDVLKRLMEQLRPGCHQSAFWDKLRDLSALPGKLIELDQSQAMGCDAHATGDVVFKNNVQNNYYTAVDADKFVFDNVDSLVESFFQDLQGVDGVGVAMAFQGVSENGSGFYSLGYEVGRWIESFIRQLTAHGVKVCLLSEKKQPNLPKAECPPISVPKDIAKGTAIPVAEKCWEHGRGFCHGLFAGNQQHDYMEFISSLKAAIFFEENGV